MCARRRLPDHGKLRLAMVGSAHSDNPRAKQILRTAKDLYRLRKRGGPESERAVLVDQADAAVGVPGIGAAIAACVDAWVIREAITDDHPDPYQEIRETAEAYEDLVGVADEQIQPPIAEVGEPAVP
ncbi:hypothetical protein NDR87_31065 [Nocardia sp. CDC159]|uniref:Uncharacterized protein n=1 Tax=Nocardia pulmonis TaxID=2951408 RepID=A0A9X2EFI3_9NOCA|nr:MULTISPECIES: hypothetical protein [Nocardia]MCM6778008.1 hypothetical protein [Nocardia pulmonis]MCM6790821.1 hypothetical protein [Nocardia sp. CDC159]